MTVYVSWLQVYSCFSSPGCWSIHTPVVEPQRTLLLRFLNVEVFQSVDEHREGVHGSHDVEFHRPVELIRQIKNSSGISFPVNLLQSAIGLVKLKEGGLTLSGNSE